jgi:hypothetical protein
VTLLFRARRKRRWGTIARWTEYLSPAFMTVFPGTDLFNLSGWCHSCNTALTVSAPCGLGSGFALRQWFSILHTKIALPPCPLGILEWSEVEVESVEPKGKCP